MYSQSLVSFSWHSIKTTSWLMGITSLLILSHPVAAQTPSANDSLPSTSGGSFSSPINDWVNSTPQYSQPSLLINPNNGSQRFFQEGRDNLYFLPEESENSNLLNLDESIEAEGIKYEDLYQNQRQNN